MDSHTSKKTGIPWFQSPQIERNPTTGRYTSSSISFRPLVEPGQLHVRTPLSLELLLHQSRLYQPLRPSDLAKPFLPAEHNQTRRRNFGRRGQALLHTEYDV